MIFIEWPWKHKVVRTQKVLAGNQGKKTKTYLRNEIYREKD